MKQEEVSEQRVMRNADLVCTSHVIYTQTTKYFLVLI
jgi:hypothetical protein